MTAAVIKLPALDQEITIAPDWIAARDQIITDAASIPAVTDDQAFKLAAELLRRITKTSNAMEAFRKQYAEPYAEAAKTIKRAADDAREPLEKAKARIQAQLNSYAAEQKRQAESERKRIEAEQRAEVERRIFEQEKTAAEAEELGLPAPEAAPIEQPPADLPVISPPKADAVRVQVDVAWAAADEEKIDRAFLSLDPKKINEYARANKERIVAIIKDDAAAATTILTGIVFKVQTRVISR